MENLSTRGLVDLGHSFLVRGNQRKQKNILEQALALAAAIQSQTNRGKGARRDRSVKATAEQSGRSSELPGTRFTFYQQGGYRSEAFSCLALFARANLQKGDYAAADKGHEELLRLAQELNDQSLTARAHAERGSSLAREERYTEALDHLNQAYAINSSQGIQRSMGYNLENRGEVLGRLGPV